MANMMEKVGEKLHMGGHKKEDKHQPGAHPTPVAPAGYVHDPHHTGAGATAGAPAAGAHQEGFMGKMKNKVKGGKDKTKAKAHGGDSSSSSSESDGEGGHRKKKVVY
ncbi:hypothetical protein GOP47_0016920 [Adiantum capillus-veneris]|uniref:Dehydrin n=1 Tax=Adiantum capillus-veneris TaxID=13818 RepID=A0A9D4ZCK2_ADICA|nr:hypothetical protein GOP47_0016920 [Adiantum capillus-veneris]